MKSGILYLFTRTPLHIGAGSSVGAIDMPVQRERHTQIPIIPGSGLKGVLRDLWSDDSENQKILFGSDPKAQFLQIGNLLVGEARVLCFPVRSAKGSFAWLTSPLTLQRYVRELKEPLKDPLNGLHEKLQAIKEENCLAGDDVRLSNGSAGNVVLEEYCFKAESLPKEKFHFLRDAMPGDPLWATIDKRLVIVSDGIFSHFCANACEVQQRVCINDDTGTVENLFNQENVPSETLLYAVIGERKDLDHLQEVKKKLGDVKGILQIGGDETIGLGFCSVTLGDEIW